MDVRYKSALLIQMTRAPAPDVPAPVGLSVEVDQEGAKGTTFAIARSACLAIGKPTALQKTREAKLPIVHGRNINLRCLSSLGGAEEIHGVPPCLSCRWP
jgi:hypothetical protein